MARGNAAGLEAAGYQDDPSRWDKEELRLELELSARLGTGAEHEATPAGGDDTGAVWGGRRGTGNEKMKTPFDNK